MNCEQLAYPNVSDIPECYKNMMVTGTLGSVIGALIAIGILIILILMLGVYIYNSLAWMSIAKKLKYKKSWLAWIPFANISMWLQLGKLHWAWIFLIFIPIFGWIALLALMTVATWRIFEKRKYPAWLSLIIPLGFIPTFTALAILAYFVIIGLVAWKNRQLDF